MNLALREQESVELDYAGAQKCTRCKTVWPENSEDVVTVEFSDGEKITVCDDPCRTEMLEANESFECAQCLIAFDNSEKTEDEAGDEFCQGCA